MMYVAKQKTKKGRDRILIYEDNQLVFTVDKRLAWIGHESIFHKDDQAFLQVKFYDYLFFERITVVKDLLKQKLEFDLANQKVNLIRNGSRYKIKKHYFQTKAYTVYKDDIEYAVVRYNWHDLMIKFLFPHPDEMPVLYFLLIEHYDAVS